MIGVCLPLFSRMIPVLKTDRDLFIVVSLCFRRYPSDWVHALSDSSNYLMSDCLPEHRWKKFPFTTFVAMLSALVTLKIDSSAMSFYRMHRFDTSSSGRVENGVDEMKTGDKDLRHVENGNAYMGHSHGFQDSELLRNHVVGQVLELGIVVHSVVIGLSMGASDNPCTIRPLIAAICFRQLFEGMGLGGCILKAEYGMKMKAMLVFFFSITTPFVIALGIGLSNVYSEDSLTAQFVVGLLNASSAGLLNYVALVELLATDFMGLKLQNSMRLQVWAYIAVLLGAGGMSPVAEWAEPIRRLGRTDLFCDSEHRNVILCILLPWLCMGCSIS